MMMGVLLHASNVYLPAGGWLVSDPQRGGAFFEWLSGGIHVFRMPAFFWISGWLTAATFVRVGTRTALLRRVQRLFIPLVASLLTLNLLQEFVLARHEGAQSLQVWRDGIALFHLWFLLDLVFFVPLVPVVLAFARRLRSGPGEILLASHWSLTILGLGMLSALPVMIPRLTGLSEFNLLGLSNLYRLFSYAPFYFGGLFMFFRPKLHRSLCATPRLIFVIALLLALLSRPWLKVAGPLIGEIVQTLGFVFAWACVGALLNLLRRTIANAPILARLSSEVSYTVYLFHHVIVVMLGLALIDLPWSAGCKFLVLVTLTLGITVGIHVLAIQRLPLLSLAFNGRWPTSMPNGFRAWLRAPHRAVRESSPPTVL